MDKIIFFMFGLLFSFCIIGAVYFSIWTEKKSPNHWYVGSANATGQYAQYAPGNPAFVGFASFITSFILYGKQTAVRRGQNGLGCSGPNWCCQGTEVRTVVQISFSARVLTLWD